MKAFNIRIYGLLLNSRNEVLVSDEHRFGMMFTKFPGGGLEWGEGLVDALRREFREEVKIDVEVIDLFYLTDYFQPSAFDNEQQIISAYYIVDYKDWLSIPVECVVNNFNGKEEVHRWVAFADLTPADFKFPIDRLVAEKLRSKFNERINNIRE